MSNFTPGKWTSHFDGHGGICIEADEKQIGFVSKNTEQEANARLIAAAPEMHHFLELIYKLQAEGRMTIPDELDYKFITDIAAILDRIDNPEANDATV